MRPLTYAAVAALVVAGGAVPAASGTWHEEQTLDHGGLTRYFRYYVPDTLPPNHPVVFLLHGGGGSMREITEGSGGQVEWPAIADDEGFLLIVPNGVDDETGDPAGDDQQWNDCRGDAVVSDPHTDDVGFVAALADWALFHFEVDNERIYATGASNGGMMSYRLADELGDRIAAIAAFIANIPAESECEAPSRPVPVFICNGDGERFYMPWDGGCVASASCDRGTVISALETRARWIDILDTETSPSETTDYPDIDPTDGCTVESELYTGGREGSEVHFYRVRNGGHNTPTIAHPIAPLALWLLGLGNQDRDIESARHAWDFLARHTLSGPRTGGPSPGAVADLRVVRNPDGSLQLSWARDCGGATTYGIYRGDLRTGLGSLEPEPGQCGVPRTNRTVPPGDRPADFFLVVPDDGSVEGSYGTGSDGAARGGAGTRCRPAGTVDACAW
jgi:polyhydroxybutyrate depolymerase